MQLYFIRAPIYLHLENLIESCRDSVCEIDGVGFSAVQLGRIHVRSIEKKLTWHFQSCRLALVHIDGQQRLNAA